MIFASQIAIHMEVINDAYQIEELHIHNTNEDVAN